jgi:hypothetical protein
MYIELEDFLTDYLEKKRNKHEEIFVMVETDKEIDAIEDPIEALNKFNTDVSVMLGSGRNIFRKTHLSEKPFEVPVPDKKDIDTLMSAEDAVMYANLKKEDYINTAVERVTGILNARLKKSLREYPNKRNFLFEIPVIGLVSSDIIKPVIYRMKAKIEKGHYKDVTVQYNDISSPVVVLQFSI